MAASSNPFLPRSDSGNNIPPQGGANPFGNPALNTSGNQLQSSGGGSFHNPNPGEAVGANPFAQGPHNSQYNQAFPQGQPYWQAGPQQLYYQQPQQFQPFPQQPLLPPPQSQQPHQPGVSQRNQAANRLNQYGKASETELMILREWFNAVDEDGGGSITAVELSQALRAGGENFSEETVKNMIRMFDNDGGAAIDFDEFALLFRYIQAVRESFNLQDTNKDGFLSPAEVKTVIQKSPEFNFADQKTFDKLIKKFDRFRQNKLDFAQYFELAVFLGNIKTVFDVWDGAKAGRLVLDFEYYVGLNSAI